MNQFENLQVLLHVTEPAGLIRADEPVRIGVPLPKGAVHDVSELMLDVPGGDSPQLQARALARWSDGSVQWALLDTLVSLPAGQTLQLWLKKGAVKSGGPSVKVLRQDGALAVDTGAATFKVPCRGSTLIESVHCGGSEMLGSGGVGINFLDGKGRSKRPLIHRARVDDEGPVRATLRLDGHIEGTDRRRPLQFVASLAFTAGSAVVQVDFRIRNPRRARHKGGLWDLGDPGSQHIRELGLQVTPAGAPDRLQYNTGPAQPPVQARDLSGWVLYQDSSGGEHWDSPNHLGADGKPTVSFRGYQVRDGRGVVLASGDRATPCAELVLRGGAIACGVEGFWQNFPKALRWANGSLQVALFPAETRQPIELQGGEQKRHRTWLSFGLPGEAASAVTHRHQPLQVRLDPRHIEGSRAIHGFVAPRADDDTRYRAYMDTIVEGEHSFFAGRELIDEYGWRNFGDVYADHEAVHHKGPGLFISHYNNQYDVVLGTLLQGFRSSDPRWLELSRDLARHVVDIDIYHTGDDKAAYNGGLFWHSDHYLPAGLATHRTYSRLNARGSYGGGPDNEHNYTSGLMLWHFLTGDADMAEAVLSLAGFVMAMDDGSRTIFRLFDKGPTGNASKTVSLDYHGPGRGAGNSINALLDAFWLTRDRSYLSKAEELVQRCVHPEDDIAALKLDEPEYRWSYLVFLQVLGKYLSLKDELGELDHGRSYARDSLLHYAMWMMEHERPYSEQLHKVLLPTETWPAQDIRKAHVLAIAARYMTDPSMASAAREQSVNYWKRCLGDTLGFSTAHLVRPRVLLATYGTVALPEAPAAPLPQGEAPIVYARRNSFVAQKRRVIARLFRRRMARS